MELLVTFAHTCTTTQDRFHLHLPTTLLIYHLKKPHQKPFETMPKYGIYEVTDDKMAKIEEFKNDICEGNDFELGIDCSGSMMHEVGHGDKRTRFNLAREILIALAPHIFKFDPSIDLWEIRQGKPDEDDMERLANVPKPQYKYLKDEIKNKDELKTHLQTLSPGGNTPLRQVLTEALGRYVETLRINVQAGEQTKPLNLIIAGDGHEGKEEIIKVIQQTAIAIDAITREDASKYIGIQFILVSSNAKVKKEMEELDEKCNYQRADGTLIETDIVDVTLFETIEGLGGITSPLCIAKLLGGSRHKVLDNLLAKLPKA